MEVSYSTSAHTQPTRISGALYHLVVTYSVMEATFELLEANDIRARPKSATFREQFEFTRMFLYCIIDYRFTIK